METSLVLAAPYRSDTDRSRSCTWAGNLKKKPSVADEELNARNEAEYGRLIDVLRHVDSYPADASLVSSYVKKKKNAMKNTCWTPDHTVRLGTTSHHSGRWASWMCRS